MIKALEDWRNNRILRRHPIDNELWHSTVARLDMLDGLNREELLRLRRLATLFIHKKTFYGTHELIIDGSMEVAIAAQATLPIMNLDLSLYNGWYSIVLYPGTFVARRQYQEETGLVHSETIALDGETTEQGPVVLSWEDARPGNSPRRGARNVVIHEFAHKLDLRDGVANGIPPLHDNMRVEEWASAFITAYEHMTHAVAEHTAMFDPYGATDPGEFFAVMTEVFFQTPRRLANVYPDVYRQMVLYFRQDPGDRLSD